MHLKAADGTPMANVMLTLLHKLGVNEVETFGDSTGECALAKGGRHEDEDLKGTLRKTQSPLHALQSSCESRDRARYMRNNQIVAVIAYLSAVSGAQSKTPVADAAMRGDAAALRP